MYADPDDFSLQRRITPDWVRSIRRWAYQNKSLMMFVAVFSSFYDQMFHIGSAVSLSLDIFFDVIVLGVWNFIFSMDDRLGRRVVIAFYLGLFYVGIATSIFLGNLFQERSLLDLTHAASVYVYGLWFIVRSDSTDLGEPKPGLKAKVKAKIKDIRLAIALKPAINIAP